MSELPLDTKGVRQNHCPVCRSGVSGSPTYTYSINQAAAHFCFPARNPDRFARMVECLRWLWPKEHCSVFHCDQCGFGFADPHVGGNEEFYEILHEEYGYPGWRWDYDVAAEWVLKCTAHGNILDEGAGSGVFLSRLGNGWNKFAVEGSATTRGLLESRGIHVFRDLAEACSFNIKFNVVTMFQVLEHVAPFAEMLEACHTLMPALSRILITVPEASAMRLQERATGCADMPPNHVNKWTKMSLSLALRASGFVVNKVESEDYHFSKLKSLAHLRLLADRLQPNSLAERAYRLRSRKARAAVLALLAGPALLRLIPNLRQLSRGGAFATLATRL